MKLFKTLHNPTKKVQDLVQRLFALKMPGSQFKPLTVKVCSAPISQDIYIAFGQFFCFIMSPTHEQIPHGCTAFVLFLNTKTPHDLKQ